jgi:hypothetical protein
MPAYGMAAPRSDPSQLNETWRLSAPIANPSIGAAVTMDPFSGPSGSPLDAKVYPPGTYQPTPAQRVADITNASTGALATGIGFGMAAGVSGGIDGSAGIDPRVGQNQLPARTGNFGANYQPGLTATDGSAAADASYVAIGGGRTNATPVKAGDYSNTLAVNAPYTPVPIMAFGMGGSRDAGAGPAFTGFGMKLLAAAADVAFGGVVATGFVNRQGVSNSKALAADVGVPLNGTTDANSGWYGQVPLWQFASASAASVAPTMAEDEGRAAKEPPKAAFPGKPPTKEEDEKLRKEFDEGLKKEIEHKPQPKK